MKQKTVVGKSTQMENGENLSEIGRMQSAQALKDFSKFIDKMFLTNFVEYDDGRIKYKRPKKYQSNQQH